MDWFLFFFFCFSFFPKRIQRSAIAVYLQKLQGLVYTHHNNSYYFLGSHYLKQMVEESWSPAGCFPRGRQLLLVTAGQMSNSDSQDTYFIKKKKRRKILFGGNTASQTFPRNKNAETSVQNSKITFRVLYSHLESSQIHLFLYSHVYPYTEKNLTGGLENFSLMVETKNLETKRKASLIRNKETTIISR